MIALIKDLKVGQYVQGDNPDNILRVESAVKTPSGVSVRFSLHGALTDFKEYNQYDSFNVVTLH